MEFEFDPKKSVGNQQKHGVDFNHAQALWNDPDLIEFRLNWPGEPRWAAVGIMKDRHWTAIFTRRQDHIRIISVRRSHAKEERLYERYTSEGIVNDIDQDLNQGS